MCKIEPKTYFSDDNYSDDIKVWDPMSDFSVEEWPSVCIPDWAQLQIRRFNDYMSEKTHIHESDAEVPTLERAYEMDQRKEWDDQINLERQFARSWDIQKEDLNDSDIGMLFD